MFDHITLTAGNFAKARSFYEKTLAPLGFKELAGEEGEYCGFGVDRPFFWIGASDASHLVSTSVHVAFAATNIKQVDEFYKAAIAAGAKDNGAPGYRNEYHAGYYAAFVLDLDGNNIEVVYRDPSASVVS